MSHDSERVTIDEDLDLADHFDLVFENLCCKNINIDLIDEGPHYPTSKPREAKWGGVG
jgi:hypothetical protein